MRREAYCSSCGGLSGEVSSGDSAHWPGLCHRPTCNRSQALQKALVILHRRRECLHRLGFREPETPCAISPEARFGARRTARRHADRTFRGRALRGRDEFGACRCRVCRGIRRKRGLWEDCSWTRRGQHGRPEECGRPATKPADQRLEVVDDLVQQIPQSRRDDAARLSEPFLHFVNERGQVIQTHAARGSRGWKHRLSSWTSRWSSSPRALRRFSRSAEQVDGIRRRLPISSSRSSRVGRGESRGRAPERSIHPAGLTFISRWGWVPGLRPGWGSRALRPNPLRLCGSVEVREGLAWCGLISTGPLKETPGSLDPAGEHRQADQASSKDAGSSITDCPALVESTGLR